MKVFLVVAMLVAVAAAVWWFVGQRQWEVLPERGAAAFEVGGTYENAVAEITVTEIERDQIRVVGNAFWEGSDPDSGQVNSGTIDGVVILSEGQGVYKKEGCEIKMAFAENKLTAKDNNQCGGLNVTFTGEYAKK